MKAKVNFASDKDSRIARTISVKSGAKPGKGENPAFVSTPYHDQILSEMVQAHFQGDFCLFGEKGTGKTALIHQFASLLDYQVLCLQNLFFFEKSINRSINRSINQSTN